MAATKKGRQPRRPTTSEVGGHTALTPERQAVIVANVTKGTYLEVAARAAGVSGPTYRRWMANGADRVDPDTQESIVAPEPYRSFRAAVEQAEADVEMRATEQALAGSMALPFGNTQGLFTFLARRFRQRWTPKDTIEVSGPEGGPIEVKGDDVDRITGVLEAFARAGIVILPGNPVSGADQAAVISKIHAPPLG